MEANDNKRIADLLSMVADPEPNNESTSVLNKEPIKESSVQNASPVKELPQEQQDDDDIIDMGDDYDFDGFQVVRREFFAHTFVPAVTFNDCKFYVNTACLNKFPEMEYAQVLVNRETKILALRPCSEGERDSYQWCSVSKGKRKPKQVTCKLFFFKIISMMGWNPDYRYKLLGRVIRANGEFLLVFDLTATEVYRKVAREGKKPVASRTPVYPAGWQDQFGLPYQEHRQSMQINIFDGYAIYAIKEKAKTPNQALPSAPVQPEALSQVYRNSAPSH